MKNLKIGSVGETDYLDFSSVKYIKKIARNEGIEVEETKNLNEADLLFIDLVRSSPFGSTPERDRAFIIEEINPKIIESGVKNVCVYFALLLDNEEQKRLIEEAGVNVLMILGESFDGKRRETEDLIEIFRKL